MDFPMESGIEISDDSNSFEEIEAVSDHSGSSSPVTPKAPVPLSFGSAYSDATHPNHDDSDFSFSELDSEAEAFYSSLNHHLLSPDLYEFSDKQPSYGELMMKYVQCEEESRTTALQLQDSEQEIEKLKGEIAEKRESALLLAENLRADELETARREIETKDAVIETEKRRALELQRQVVDLESQLSDSTLQFDNVVNELEASKTKLETDIAGLLENQAFLEAQVKDLEKHKVGYEMLMAEKDAEADDLKAEMRSRDIQIKQMEEQLNQLVFRETELVCESGNAKSIVEELTARVKELEKQGEQQRNALSQGEEEKREAIRQLCYSLDHYKSGYRQLLRFLSNK